MTIQSETGLLMSQVKAPRVTAAPKGTEEWPRAETVTPPVDRPPYRRLPGNRVFRVTRRSKVIVEVGV